MILIFGERKHPESLVQVTSDTPSDVVQEFMAEAVMIAQDTLLAFLFHADSFAKRRLFKV